jgi:hypothetical protein
MSHADDHPLRRLYRAASAIVFEGPEEGPDCTCDHCGVGEDHSSADYCCCDDYFLAKSFAGYAEARRREDLGMAEGFVSVASFLVEEAPALRRVRIRGAPRDAMWLSAFIREVKFLDDWYEVSYAAQLMRCSERTVRRLVAADPARGHRGPDGSWQCNPAFVLTHRSERST